MLIVKIITLTLATAILLLVVELVRREKLTFKYAAGWIVVAIAAILFSTFDQILFKLADVFGFELTSNFIFFSLLSIFVLLSLLMTIFLCQQDSRNATMAQKISILQFELDQLKDEKSKKFVEKQNKTDE